MTAPISSTGGAPPQLPRAGTGGLDGNSSFNFLMIASIVAALYLAGVTMIRSILGHKQAVENDRITGLG